MRDCPSLPLGIVANHGINDRAAQALAARQAGPPGYPLYCGRRTESRLRGRGGAGRGPKAGAPGGHPAPRHGARELVDEIMDMGPHVRFAAVVELDGKIASGMLRSGGVPLGPRREAERFCSRAARHRRARRGFDASLGRVSYVHVERETAAQFAVYHPEFTVCLTVEPEASIDAKISMVERVREMAGGMCGGGGRQPR